MKICSKKEACVHPAGPILQKSEFSQSKSIYNKDGLRYECKFCRRADSSQWREKNTDYSKQYKKANHKAVLASKAEYRANNKEKIAAYHKQWEIANKGKRYAQASRYRASRLNQTPIWSDPLAIEKIYADCVELNLAARTAGCPPDIQYEVDHIIPLQSKIASGLHIHTNLRIILRSENRSKSNSFIPG